MHVRDVETIDVCDMEAFEMREAEAIDVRDVRQSMYAVWRVLIELYIELS